MIQLDAVKKAFNQGHHNEVWAVRGISLELAPNLITVLKGPSGSGKTTLLAMVGCLSRPTSGRISLDGQLLSNLPERFMTQVRRSTFGFIFQQFNLIRGLTVLENIMLPAYPLAPDHGSLRNRALSLLKQFRLEDRAQSRAEWLSGGEAQRTAVCRALINDPRILIADEPTANLDTRLSRELLELIGDLVDMGKTVLVSSHDPIVFDSARVSRVVELRDGLLAGGPGMLIAPAVLALNGVASTTTVLLSVAAGFALKVLRHWDIRSGSELQLDLERRTYLISTLVAWCFISEIVSLLLFVYNAEQMSTQSVGAMCATGVLNAAPWGWTTLFLKIAVFFAGAGWLMLNRVDNQAPDYPLVRVKYGLLLGIAPLAAAEATAQWLFFIGLDPDVITSCCGALFTPEGDGVAGNVSALDPARTLAVMYVSGLAVLAVGDFYRREGAAPYSPCSAPEPSSSPWRGSSPA